MSRFNKRPSGLYAPASQPIVSNPSPTLRTGNNAPGFERDPKSELFLLAAGSFMTGQDAFYEKGKVRDERFVHLVHEVTRTDPDWMSRFLPWLRKEANIRTAALIGAAEFAAEWAKVPQVPGHIKTEPTYGPGLGRKTVDAVLMRADEPGEMLAYWLATYPGKQIPKPIKRGVADAATRLYSEFNTLKYDTGSHGVRFGDVLELTHASPGSNLQGDLFKHLIDRRHGRDGIPSSLTMLHDNAKLREQVAQGKWQYLLSSELGKGAGMTWEDVLSLAGSKVDKGLLWEAMIPNMGYMAKLRNLRNFDEAGVGVLAAQMVMDELSDPHKVARSRQLPMRFLSAFRAVSSVRWHYPLELALQHSLSNIPEFTGKTLILIDTSGSMNSALSRDSQLKFWEAAALFGIALGYRCADATVVSFSDNSKQFPLIKGESLLVALNRFRQGYHFGGGTSTELAVRTWTRDHDRVVILTDEQANYHNHYDVTASVPQHIPVITFNLNGYRAGHAPSGSSARITIGGLSDQAFKLLPVLDKRARGQWPF